MSDFEQCLNQLQLDLISLLVNFSCELGSIITRYDFLEDRRMILSNIELERNLMLLVIQIWYNNDQIWLPRGLRSDFSALFKQNPTWPNYSFGQFSVARKLIINGGAIRLRGLLFTSWCTFHTLCHHDIPFNDGTCMFISYFELFDVIV